MTTAIAARTRPEIADQTTPAAAWIPRQTPARNAAAARPAARIADQAAAAAAVTAFQTPMKKLRKASDFFHRTTIAATRATIAMMTRLIGFAFRAAFSSHWTPAQTFVATATAVWAAW